MSRVSAEARRWIGTPYVHQASTLGGGADCLGLVRGVWRALYGREPEEVPPYTPDWAEPQRDERLLAAAVRHMDGIRTDAPLAPGQCLLFRMRDGSIAKHLGILSQAGEAPRFIHAYSGRGTIESTLSVPWARRIAARFEFPDQTTSED